MLNQMIIEQGYQHYHLLLKVLIDAYHQASQGKGKERHACGQPFERQIICEIGRRVGLGYELGQAIKKAIESEVLLKIKGPEAARAELLGAINYLAAAVILIDEGKE